MNGDGELPEGWATGSLDSLTTAIQYGHTASANHGGNGPRFLRITDIQDGRVDWSGVPGCKIDSKSVEKCRLVPGDIVFARSGATTGKSYLIRDCPKDAVFASYLIRVRAERAIVTPEFLSRFFQTPAYWTYITENLAGNAQPNCNGSKLAALEVPVAPLPEQRRIVEQVEALLAEVNKAKDRLDRVKVIVKRFRQAVLAAACSGRLTEEWSGRAGEWPSAVLGDLVSQGPQNGLYKPQTAYGSGTPIVRIDDFHDGILLRPWSDLRRVTVSKKELGAYRLSEGDILINRVNSPKFVGKPLLVANPPAAAIFESNMMRFKLDGARLVPSFALLVLLSPQGRGELQKNAKHAVNQSSINQGDVRQVEFLLPPVEEQAVIVHLVQKMFALADTIEARLTAATTRAEQLPQSILSKAFKGELVPTEAELARADGRSFETAEEMLKRVHSTARGTEEPARAGSTRKRIRS